VPLTHSATKTSAAPTDRSNSASGSSQPAAAAMRGSSIKDEQEFAKVAPDETKAVAAGTINKRDSGSKTGQNQSAAAIQVPSTPPSRRKTAATPGKRAEESPMADAPVIVSDDSDNDSFNISEKVRFKQV
jgi:hypothetical protein